MAKINNGILTYVALGLSIVAVILSIYAVVQSKKRVNPFFRFKNGNIERNIARNKAKAKPGKPFAAKPAPVQKVQLPVQPK